MNSAEEYTLSQGTVMGEIRHEIFQSYGEELKNTAHYCWAILDVFDDTSKIYTLVNSTPTKFLIATVTYPLIDRTPIDPETKKRLDIPPNFMKDELNPIHLHLEWADANIPFVTRDILDKNSIQYNLPQ